MLQAATWQLVSAPTKWEFGVGVDGYVFYLYCARADGYTFYEYCVLLGSPYWCVFYGWHRAVLGVGILGPTAGHLRLLLRDGFRAGFHRRRWHAKA